MPLPEEAAQTLEQTLESLAQGLYFSEFCRCSVALIEGRRSISRYILTCLTISLFGINTAHFIAGTYQNMHNAIIGAVQNYTSILQLRDYAVVASVLIINPFMVYRCFVVWNKWRRVILLPSILCLASLGLSIWVMSRNDIPLLDLPIIPDAFFLLELVLSLILSGLIVYRIFIVQREMTRVVESRDKFTELTLRATILIIESGSLYPLLFLALVIARYTESHAATRIVYGCMVPLTGLIVSSIVTRIMMGISHGDPTSCIPIEFRNSAFNNTAKSICWPTSLPTANPDEISEDGLRGRTQFDLTN